jgi:hypothetical protein
MRPTILFTFFTIAESIKRPIVDNTQSVGINPITKFSTQFLGYQTSNNSCSHRDLGFTGHIADVWYAIYGDTVWCASGVTDPFKDQLGFHGMVRGSVSQMTDNPLTVYDLNLNDQSPVPHQLQFIPFNSSWGEDDTYGFGGTSLIEIDSTTASGAIFYLVVRGLILCLLSLRCLQNAIKNGNEAGFKGAGIAKVEVINGTPIVTKRFGDKGYWWPAESNPSYGDITAYRDKISNYIYALGYPPTTINKRKGSQYVYMVRVNATDAYDLSKYQYWHGRAVGWSSTRLTTFNAETAIMRAVGQGQIIYNHFYDCYIFVHLGERKH